MKPVYKDKGQQIPTSKSASDYIIRAPRYTIGLDLIIKEKGLFTKNRTLYTQSTDISLSGVKVLLPKPLNPEKTLNMVIFSHDQEIRARKKIKLYAKVARIHTKILSNGYKIYETGIRFQHVPNRKIPVLCSWIEKGRYIG